MNYPATINPPRRPALAWLAGALVFVAAVRPAAAQIVYTNPPNYGVYNTGGPGQIAFNFFTGAAGPGAPFGFTYDVVFGPHWWFPGISSGNSGRTVSMLFNGGSIVTLSPGTTISAASASGGATWGSSGYLSYQGTYGLLNNDTPQYAAFRIIDGASTYYGWAQMSYFSTNVVYADVHLYDFAYNSTPGASIQVGAIPEPSTYAVLLGLAVLGLVIGRRKQIAAA